MTKRHAVKLTLIALYFFISVFYFYDEHFPKTTQTLYKYGNIQFMAATMSFGVIISASIYNLALFIYLKHKQYLFYTLAQLSTLFFLINLDSIHISPFDEIFQLKSLMLFDASQLLMLLFSLLFLESFFENYNIKDSKYIIHIIFSFILIDTFFLLLFSHIIIFKFIPIFIPILYLLTEIDLEVKKKDTPFYLILIGWSLILITVMLEYAGLVKWIGFAFPFFHIAISLESIILSLAIAYKFKLLEEAKQEQQALLLQQSRLASVGEMLSSIAHQWRQPLNVISFGLMNIKKRSIGQEKNLKIIAKLNGQLQYMSTTIEDFRNFYNPSKSKTTFYMEEACKQCCTISKSALDVNDIHIEILVKEDFSFFGNQNELQQAILSIVLNARDAFVKQKIKNGEIKITIEKFKITIHDNAGGIGKEHIDKIFNPYYSTKKDGDGIGLHISRLIIEKEMKGSLTVKSSHENTTFTLRFKED
jgi:signal transduction histidine kinase